MCKDSDFFEIFYYLCIVYVLWRTIFFFMRQKRFFFYIFLFVILSTLGSCNTVKYVPEDQYLLKKVKIKASIPEPDWKPRHIPSTCCSEGGLGKVTHP